VAYAAAAAETMRARNGCAEQRQAVLYSVLIPAFLERPKVVNPAVIPFTPRHFKSTSLFRLSAHLQSLSRRSGECFCAGPPNFFM
jgi:hypothetical protein